MKPRDVLFKSDDFIKILGSQLGKIDHLLMAVLAKRMTQANLVEQWKHYHGDQPIFREVVEKDRLEQIENWAKEKGLNVNFARAFLYLIISESRQVQINQRQIRTAEEDELYKKDRETWYKLLRKNLLALTAEVANVYDHQYGEDAPFATRSYLQFEEGVINREISTLKSLKNQNLAIDLGCATGRMTFKLAPNFQKVIGYDISPEMIAKANYTKVQGANITKFRNTQFIEADIEEKIPDNDNAASLIIMNLGTASDICNIRKVIMGIKRVLKKDGRFVLSFYNSGAMVYQWFIPWPVGLAAEIDMVKHSLNVHQGGKTFSIYAKPYTVREVKNLFKSSPGLKISQVLTYPTIASMLPHEFFAEEESKETITALDNQLSKMDKGAYILVAGRKMAN